MDGSPSRGIKTAILPSVRQMKELATKSDIAEVKTSIAESKAEIIKWVVGLIFMQTGIITAILVKLIK